MFAEAFLRGVRKSGIEEYEDEDIKDLGKQFHRDATFFKSEEEQKSTFRDALILTAAIGHLYKGRADRLEKEKDNKIKKRKYEILKAVKHGYETGDFESVEPYLTEKSVFESYWVFEPLTGKEDIMGYLRGKGETLKKHNALGSGDFIVCSDGDIFLRLTPLKDDPENNEPIAILADVDEDGMISRIDLCDINLVLGDTEEDDE